MENFRSTRERVRICGCVNQLQFVDLVVVDFCNYIICTQQIVFFFLLVLLSVTWLLTAHAHTPLYRIILKFAHKPPCGFPHTKSERQIQTMSVCAVFEMDSVSCCHFLDVYLLPYSKTCCNHRAINEQFVCHQYYSEIIKFQWWRMKHISSGNRNASGGFWAQHELRASFLHHPLYLPALIPAPALEM